MMKEGVFLFVIASNCCAALVVVSPNIHFSSSRDTSLEYFKDSEVIWFSIYAINKTDDFCSAKYGEPCGSWLSRLDDPDEPWKCASPISSMSKTTYDVEVMYELCNGTGATEVHTKHIPHIPHLTRTMLQINLI